LEGGRKLVVAVGVVRVEVGGDVVIGVEPPGWCFGGEVLDGSMLAAEHVLRRFAAVGRLASDGALPVCATARYAETASP